LVQLLRQSFANLLQFLGVLLQNAFVDLLQVLVEGLTCCVAEIFRLQQDGSITRPLNRRATFRFIGD
jgi:hypothetical protein